MNRARQARTVLRFWLALSSPSSALTLTFLAMQFFRGFLEFGQSSDSSMDRSAAFDLIEELHHIAPNILLYVIPLLESMLEVSRGIGRLVECFGFRFVYIVLPRF